MVCRLQAIAERKKTRLCFYCNNSLTHRYLVSRELTYLNIRKEFLAIEILSHGHNVLRLVVNHVMAVVRQKFPQTLCVVRRQVYWRQPNLTTFVNVDGYALQRQMQYIPTHIRRGTSVCESCSTRIPIKNVCRLLAGIIIITSICA